MRHQADRRPRGAVRSLARWLGGLACLAAALVVAGALVVLLVLPQAVQGQAMTVLTGSMTPELPVGSVVLVRPVDPRTVEVGDVLTYQPVRGRATFVTHRLVRIDTSTTPTSYVLRGDANDGEDDPIVAEQIRGRVWFHVPLLGAIRDGLHGRGGALAAGAVLLGLYAVGQITAGLRQSRRDRSAPGVADDTVVVDRPLLVVTLDLTRLVHRGLGPVDVAERLGGIVVVTDDDVCVIVVPTAAADLDADLDAVRAEVEALEPRTVAIAGPGSRLHLHEPRFGHREPARPAGRHVRA